MSLRLLCFLVVFVAGAQAIPAKTTKQAVATSHSHYSVHLPSQERIERKHPPPNKMDGSLVYPNLDDAKKPCSEEILGRIKVFSGTTAGITAKCPELLAEVLDKGMQPEMDIACSCTNAFEDAVKDGYDRKYNCLLGMPSEMLYNIRLTHQLCKLAGNSTRAPKPVPLARKECHLDNCINGDCISGKCVCHMAGNSIPDHPAWIGPQCDEEWCPNMCSGHGICDVKTGVCTCDTSWESTACSQPHFETQHTEHDNINPAATDTFKADGNGICTVDYRKAWKARMKGMTETRLPQCTDNGAYERMQCNKLTHACWCVHEDGSIIDNSMRMAGYKPPDCETLTGAETAFDPRAPDARQDRCSLADLYCGAEGYCIDDPTADAPFCACINGFSGRLCETAPDEPVDWDSLDTRPPIPGREFPEVAVAA